MAHEVKTKINRLISQWPRGTVSTASYLNKLGFSHDLLVRYRKSGWLQSFGRGAYILNGDKVDWYGALYALQNQLHLNVHPGGKTALELKRYAHYLLSGQKKIFLYGKQGLVLPTWFKGDMGNDIVLTRTNLFPAESREGFSEFREMGFSIMISSPERAAMEMLHLVPRKIGFEEAFLIMENLVSLRPDVIQRLLSMCRSIKVKRLFMYIGEKQGHSWISDLEPSKINFGKGKRMIVPNGKYDTKYFITVPRDHYGEDPE
ncbi:MAG: type IV toxin-antitoxin system AbiEi family antitoxin [Deltaproteobacteria bacterium]|nr:type IV toxin-antitoxin system AbiEi family antitoxin [Deltaproteobacteria bacterium]